MEKRHLLQVLLSLIVNAGFTRVSIILLILHFLLLLLIVIKVTVM